MRVSRPTAIQSRPCTGTRPPGKRPAALRAAGSATDAYCSDWPVSICTPIPQMPTACSSRSRAQPRVRTSASCASRSLRAVMVLAVRRSARPAAPPAPRRPGAPAGPCHARCSGSDRRCPPPRPRAVPGPRRTGRPTPRAGPGTRTGPRFRAAAAPAPRRRRRTRVRGRQPHQRLAQADAGGRGGGQLLRFQRRDDAVHGGAAGPSSSRSGPGSGRCCLRPARAAPRRRAKSPGVPTRSRCLRSFPDLLACLDSPGAITTIRSD